MIISLISCLLILQAENKQAECDLLKELLQLHEDNQRTMEGLLTLKKDLETKEEEVHLFI